MHLQLVVLFTILSIQIPSILSQCNALQCSSCTALSGCGWCTDGGGSCRSGNSNGPTSFSCSTAGWSYYSSRCQVNTCSQQTSCTACTSLSNCGWCASTGTCHNGTSAGPTDGSATCPLWSWSSTYCGSQSCSSKYSCSSCIGAGCGWCGSSGTCLSGNYAGPSSGSCYGNWSLYTCPHNCYNHYSCSECSYDSNCVWCSSSSMCIPSTSRLPSTCYKTSYSCDDHDATGAIVGGSLGGLILLIILILSIAWCVRRCQNPPPRMATATANPMMQQQTNAVPMPVDATYQPAPVYATYQPGLGVQPPAYHPTTTYQPIPIYQPVQPTYMPVMMQPGVQTIPGVQVQYQ